MADTKGTNDPKPDDGKPAASRSGAVKPPVLDLTAREAGAQDRPAETSQPEPTRPAPGKPASDKPAAAPVTPARRDGGFPVVAILAGGVLGVAAAYGLASFGLWPTQPAAPQPSDPRLAQFATAIPELETVTQTTQAELAALHQRVGNLETAEPVAAVSPAAPVDLSGLETELAALKQRLDALPTTSNADTGATEALRTQLAGIGTRLDELAARVGTAESELRSLDTSVTQTSAALAAQPSDIGAVLQLPLILSGFETAFASGRPFETELAALRAAMPEAKIPTALANAAATGLARPDVIAQRLADVLPDMLAGRPAKPGADWQAGALDWIAGMVALRPTDEIEGDSPEALVTRLEGAIARRDFATAETLFAELPEPMRTAAGDVPQLVASQAEATRFLNDVRNQALTGEATR
ncbi:MAG TPA: hypothetical protein VLZ53_11935 [Devosia sp.]|nr:hypothetical protein [Devosia sp.]